MINHINERGLVKVLPVKHPPITTFQGYAVPLSIQVCYPVTFDWMYSNYINIYAFERPKRQKDDIPIIGGFLSDGVSLIMVSGVLIKNAIGVGGLLLLFCTMLMPVIKIIVFSLQIIIVLI